MNPIEAFYNNATVLVTGANGFLGSILVEKLLRCFNVKKIYVLLRSKGGKSVDERLQVLKKLAIFDEIRRKNPNLLEKLVAVEVDYNCCNLNIEPEILQKIKEETEIVFNVMASVNFNIALSDAIKTNVLATGRIVDLAKEIESLNSFVHVSTLYSNVNDYNVDEKIYPSDLSYQEFIELGLKINDKENIVDNEACNPLKLPNTYTLTKHYAEKLVNDQASNLPAGIYRPPMVVSSYKDLPGYADNLNGPPGLFSGIERGVIRCVYIDPFIRSNVLPVDYCINALIATAWDVRERFLKISTEESNVPIFNYMSAENNLTWFEADRKISMGLDPMQRKLWKFSHFAAWTELTFVILNFLFHTIPAFVLDFIATLSGKKKMYLRATRNFKKVMIALSPFNTRQWTFGNRNMKRLVEETKNFKFQRGEHSFDWLTIDWDEFYENYLTGINRYVFKNEVKYKK